jgi:hypothetical protein
VRRDTVGTTQRQGRIAAMTRKRMCPLRRGPEGLGASAPEDGTPHMQAVRERRPAVPPTPVRVFLQLVAPPEQVLMQETLTCKHAGSL